MDYFISRADAYRKRLSEDIVYLENKRRLNPLEEKRLKHLHQLRLSLDSPIHRLSDDILQHIFELVSDFGDNITQSILVSSIISRWRQVALATPRLWSKLQVTLPVTKTRSGAQLATFLERSQNAYLNVFVKMPTLLSGPALISAKTLLQRLAPRLEKLSLEYKYLAGPDVPWSTIIPNTFSGRLRYLTLAHLQFSSGPVGTFQQLLVALDSCSGLRTLRISFEDQDIARLPSDPIIHLPQLEVLYLCSTLDPSISFYFASLLEGHPRTLHFNLAHVTTADFVPHLTIPCFQTIKTLVFRNRWYIPTAHGLFSLMKKLPRLTMMQLVGVDFQEYLNPAIVLPDTHFASDLQFLDLGRCRLDGLDHFFQALAGIGTDQRPVDAPLRLGIHIDSGVPEDVDSWLREHGSPPSVISTMTSASEVIRTLMIDVAVDDMAW